MDSINQPVPVSSVPPTPVGESTDNTAVSAVAPQMSQEQMKANLQEMMSKIEAKYQEYNTQKFSSDNKIKEQQGETLRQIFDLFKSNGVDPNNVDEIGAFFKKIETTKPQLFQQLEAAFKSILGEDLLAPEENGSSVEESTSENPTMPSDVDTSTVGAIPADNMNINTNETPPQS